MPETRLSSDKTSTKRLEQLRKQVYGKAEFTVRSPQFVEKNNITTNYQLPTTNSDITYLRQDLTKIAILSTLVLGIQLFLYYAVSHNLIRLTI